MLGHLAVLVRRGSSFRNGRWLLLSEGDSGELGTPHFASFCNMDERFRSFWKLDNGRVCKRLRVEVQSLATVTMLHLPFMSNLPSMTPQRQWARRAKWLRSRGDDLPARFAPQVVRSGHGNCNARGGG